MAEQPISDSLGIFETIRTLRELHGSAPRYQALWLAIGEGRVPAHRQGREWRIRRTDLPRVAEVFRLAARSRAA